MTTLNHIAEWAFNPEDTFSLSDADKVTASRGVVRLVRGQPDFILPGHPSEVYTLDDDVYVKTPLFSPGSLVTWGFVEALGETPKDEEGEAVTSFALRIHTGVESQYWNGTAWAAAAAGNWNTLAEMNTNLVSYTGGSVAIEVRLKTTDKLYTPSLRAVKLKWSGRAISFMNEWLFRTLIAGMKAGIRPVSDYTLKPTGGTSLDLNDFPLDAGFEISDVVSVYDHSNDPSHSNDLFGSYDSGTKVVTLSSEVANGDTAWVVFRYSVPVAVTTSINYENADAKIPAIWITAVRSPNRRTLGSRGPYIMNRAEDPPLGVAFPQPIMLVSLDITYAVLAPGALDLNVLHEALLHWISSHPVITSPALDARVRLRGRDAFDWATGREGARDPHYLTGALSLVDVPMIGDLSSSAADGSQTAIVGAVAAGNPNFPGVGYGVRSANLTFRVTEGTGTDTVSIIE